MEAIQVVLIAVLSALFFYVGIWNVKGLFWGRSGTDFPVLPFQQRILGLTWGSGLLLIVAKRIVLSVWPESMMETTSHGVTGIIMLAGGVTTFVVVLLDQRKPDEWKKDRTGRFLFVLGWFFVAIMSLLLFSEVWSLFAR